MRTHMFNVLAIGDDKREDRSDNATCKTGNCGPDTVLLDGGRGRYPACVPTRE
jgi:aerobic-type carbon monoxide dehydrogenase small subunit (CoxS/CutS family)